MKSFGKNDGIKGDKSRPYKKGRMQYAPTTDNLLSFIAHHSSFASFDKRGRGGEFNKKKGAL
ncbi:MAG: hypothetical protein Kow0090_04270 [Myxococcota bacterium]